VPIKTTANTARTWNRNGIPPGLKCTVATTISALSRQCTLDQQPPATHLTV
jgi:hypothetical protein